MDWLTNGPTNGPTDQWMDIPSYRDARTHLKTQFHTHFNFLLKTSSLTQDIKKKRKKKEGKLKGKNERKKEGKNERKKEGKIERPN